MTRRGLVVLVPVVAAVVTLASCSRPRAPVRVDGPVEAPAVEGHPDAMADHAAAPIADAGPGEASAGRAQIDPDGNDDGYDPGAPPLAPSYTPVRIGKPPLSWQRICDIAPLGDRIVLAHANQPLGIDGATLTTFRPAADDPSKPPAERRPFAVAFDWNRFGEPSKGGGAGQGFIRVRRIGGRLFVPDADPPYNGLGVVEQGTEGYVFVSDASGAFAPARAPHFRVPRAPDGDGGAGAGVVPRAYHVIDVVAFRGRIYTSTGSVPPKARAWSGPSPGALHVANADLTRWTYEVGFPEPYPGGVWRLTFLVRFRDRLYAGIQDYDGRSPWDYVYYAPSANAPAITPGDGHPVRVTPGGAAFTLRWFADGGRLYWIAGSTDGVKVRVTSDGDTWEVIDLPAEVGRPTDIKRFRGALVVQAERGLVALEAGGPRVIGRVTDKKSPFAFDDIFCAAPLGVLDGDLYVGSQRDGSLWRWAASP